MCKREYAREGLAGGGGFGVMRLSSGSLGVGKALDGELAQLVRQAGPN